LTCPTPGPPQPTAGGGLEARQPMLSLEGAP
jgi:hypothetical protein